MPRHPAHLRPGAGLEPRVCDRHLRRGRRSLSSTDQLGDTTSHTYAPAGQVLTTTDPRSKVTSNCFYYQNAVGVCADGAPAGGGSGDDLYSTTTPATSADPSGETTTTTYYPGDQSDVTTNPAGTTTNTFDANLGLATVTYSGTASGYTAPTNLSYSYNVDGSRHTMVDATGTTTYGYDANGDVTSQALVANTGLTNTTTSFTYFTTGVLATVTYPAYGTYTAPAVTYGYDATGAMVSEVDWLANKVTFAHDADGNSTNQANNVSVSNPNGTSATAFAFDHADQNTQAASTLAQICGGNEMLTQTFAGTGGSRNADNQVTQDSSSYTGSCSGQTSYQRNYSYDLAGRVVYQGTVPQGTGANMFGYDPSGDPTTISSHDPAGSFNTYGQTFDNAGQTLTQTPATGSGGTLSTYGYDTLGDQTLRTAPLGATTASTYDPTSRLTAVTARAMPQTLAAGDYHSLAIKSDGTVWAWGYNNCGQLGDGSYTNRTAPVQVSGLTGVVAVSAGSAYSLAVKADGTVWAWGINNNGELGNNSTTASDIPVQVSGLTGVVAVAAGYSHSLALKSDGTVWAWGDNLNGDLGNNSTTQSLIPVQVSGLTGMTAIAGGELHSLAVKSDGTVWAWGLNDWGQLGNNSLADSHVPVQVSGLSGVTGVAAGLLHSVAVKSDGTVWAWGDNNDGQLGNNTTTYSETPVQASGLTGATAVAAGVDTSVAAKSDGTVWAWGDNTDGQLGNNSTTDSSIPVQASGLTGATLVAAGLSHTLALKSDGTAWASGDNDQGQLGNNTTTDSSVPTQSNMSSVTASGSGNTSATYIYNGDGLNAAKSLNGTTSQYTWGQPGSTLPIILSDRTFHYIYGPSATSIEQINLTTSTPTYMTYTPSDSSWLTTNNAGDQTGYWRYDAYGNLATGTSSSAFGYSGEYADTTTGLVNDRARWYQPQTGAFTGRDPQFSSTDTAYTYANNDPVNSADVTGAEAFDRTCQTVGWTLYGTPIQGCEWLYRYLAHTFAGLKWQLEAWASIQSYRTYMVISRVDLLGQNYPYPPCTNSGVNCLSDVTNNLNYTFSGYNTVSGVAPSLFHWVNCNYINYRPTFNFHYLLLLRPAEYIYGKAYGNWIEITDYCYGNTTH